MNLFGFILFYFLYFSSFSLCGGSYTGALLQLHKDPQSVSHSAVSPYPLSMKWCIPVRIAAVVAIAKAVVAHGNEMDDMMMDANTPSNSIDNNNTPTPSVTSTLSLVPVPHVEKHLHGVPILETHLAPEERLYWESYDPTTFFNYPNTNQKALRAHVTTMVLAVLVIYPLFLVFRNAKRTRMALVSLVVYGATCAAAIVSLSVFMASADKHLYPGNAYVPMTAVWAVMAIAHFVFTVLALNYQYGRSLAYIGDYDHEMSPGAEMALPSITLYDLSNRGSSDGSENGQDLALKTSQNSMYNDGIANNSHQPLGLGLDNIDGIADHQRDLLVLQHGSENGSRWFILENKWINAAVDRLGHWCVRIASVLTWLQFAYFLVYVPTGVAIMARYGFGITVFNLLAHFIKGGVFFVYGMVSLARYCGAWSNKGWNWNARYLTTHSNTKSTWWNRIQPDGLITMEWIELFLICFYGCTNIFLENLASTADGKGYSAKDLQHASIAFIYIGCGACGLLVESKLSKWRYNRAIESLGSSRSLNVIKASPGFSPNPFPLMTVYFTGAIMSKHMQSSPLLTAIHIQWGQLFTVGCGFRLLLYILKYLKPEPHCKSGSGAPMTELITLFCLLGGGLIFMESTDPVIQSMEYYGLTEMFSFNVSVGLVTLFMAWEMFLLNLRDKLKH